MLILVTDADILKLHNLHLTSLGWSNDGTEHGEGGSVWSSGEYFLQFLVAVLYTE